MTTRRWLPVMMRARQALEDAAAQQVAAARRDTAQAIAAANGHSARVAAMNPGQPMTGDAFVAAAAMRGVAAATHSAAAHRVGFAEQRVGTTVAALNAAALQRRTIEKLVEREAEEAQATMLANAQRELDDLTVTRFGRQVRP